MSSDFLVSEKPRSAQAGAPDPAGSASRSRLSQPPPRRRSWRSFVTAAVVAAALAGGTGATALGSGTPANAAVASASQSGPGHMTGMHGGWMLPLHGQFVVAKAGGGYQTLDFQSGSVSKVSTSSITVKSTDGFTQDYAITGSTVVSAQRDGISSVKAGDQAIVVATVSGGTRTAVKVVDRTQLMQSHKQLGFGAGDQG
ncbi:MAG TPA: hypothetical protein VMB74_01085 [Streptosporangiaceae bacterium]|nr:hypothetical protein [Streptosporangiaceae bacterium]